MDQTGQYYFSVALLETIIAKFKDPAKAPAPGYGLRGFVFIPGYDAGGSAGVFPFPLFSPNLKGGTDGDILVQNTDPADSGCPYPPPCSDRLEGGNCYQ